MQIVNKLSTLAGFESWEQVIPPNQHLSIPAWRLVLKAKDGVPLLNYSSEWDRLCFVTYKLCQEDKSQHQKSWQLLLNNLGNKTKLEVGMYSGSDLLETLADLWMQQNINQDGNNDE